MNDIIKQDTYVYEGVEVVKTGREAIKKITISASKVRELKLVEIKPLDDFLSWKKWVDPSALFNIVE
jgi:hypothetical protein